MRPLLLAALLPTLLSAAPINEPILLDAIAQVETGNRDLVGKAFERGPFQMLPSICARVGGHDKRAALKWLHIVEADLGRRGIEVSAWSCSMSWNAGVRCVAEGRAPVSTYLYAQRVLTLYLDHLPAIPTRAAHPFSPPMFVIPSHP